MLIEEFEEPADVVHNYISSLDQEEICRRVSFRKIVSRALIILTISVIVFLAFYSYLNYSLYQEIKNTIIVKEETIIK